MFYRPLLTLVTLLTISCGAAPSPDALAPGPECDAENTLAYLADLDEPVATRSEFLLTPPQYRKALHASLPTEVRASMWQDKLRDAMSEPSVTPEEAALLAELATMMTPQLWTRPETPDARFEAQVALVQKTMGDERFGELAHTLEDFGAGSADAPEVSAAFTASAARVNCNCSTNSDWCSGLAPATVHCASKKCTTVKSDCGTFGLYDCNGRCKLGAPPPQPL